MAPIRKDTPGAGLGQLLDATEDIEIEEELTHTECKWCGATLIMCPACRGTTFETLEQLAGDAGLAKYGEYRWTQCKLCLGEARVSIAKAERWRLQQQSASPP